MPKGAAGDQRLNVVTEELPVTKNQDMSKVEKEESLRTGKKQASSCNYCKTKTDGCISACPEPEPVRHIARASIAKVPASKKVTGGPISDGERRPVLCGHADTKFGGSATKSGLMSEMSLSPAAQGSRGPG